VHELDGRRVDEIAAFLTWPTSFISSGYLVPRERPRRKPGVTVQLMADGLIMRATPAKENNRPNACALV